MSDRYAPPSPRPTLPQERIMELRARVEASLAGAQQARVAGIYEKFATGVLVRRDEARIVPGVGLAGDHAQKDFWRGKRVEGREVSISSREVLDSLGVEWHRPGDNLVVEGIDLHGIAVGAILRIGEEVVLERSAATHRPCGLYAERAGAVAYAFTYAENLRGILCYARRGGIIRVGDAVVVADPATP